MIYSQNSDNQQSVFQGVNAPPLKTIPSPFETPTAQPQLSLRSAPSLNNSQPSLSVPPPQESKDLTQAVKELTQTIKGEAEKQDVPESPFAPSTELPSEYTRDARGRIREKATGRFVPMGKLREEGIIPPSSPLPNHSPYQDGDGGSDGRRFSFSPRLRRGFQAGRNLYGASSLEQAFSQVPFVGGLLSQGLGSIRSFGMQASSMELISLQAQQQFLGMGGNNQAYPSLAIRSQVNDLSTRLGISPQQAVNTLKNVGMAQGNLRQMSVREMEGLTLMGYDPTSIAGLSGQMGMYGVQGDVLRTMGQGTGLQGSQRLQFAQSLVGFATGRIQSGLGVESVGRLASRVSSMGGNVMSNLQTIQRAQGISIRSAGGLTSAFGGVVDSVLQAYAMEQEGGNLLRATRRLEDMTGEEMYSALLQMGMDEETAQTMLVSGGQLTTRDAERIARQKGGGVAPRMRLPSSQEEGLRASRAFSQKQQRDLDLAFSKPQGEESVISRLETLLQQESEFQRSQLAKVPDSETIKGLSTAMIAFNDTVNAVAVPTIQAVGSALNTLTSIIGTLVKHLGNNTVVIKSGVLPPAQQQRNRTKQYSTTKAQILDQL